MLEKLRAIEEELAGFESLDADLDDAVKKEKKLADQYRRSAADLTKAREALARKFEKEMENVGWNLF